MKAGVLRLKVANEGHDLVKNTGLEAVAQRRLVSSNCELQCEGHYPAKRASKGLSLEAVTQ